MRLSKIIALFCLVLSMPVASHSQAVTFQTGSGELPPFTGSSGNMAGELIGECLERLGYDIRTEGTSLADAMDKVRLGLLDGITAVWPSAERDLYLRFSAPVLENRLILVGRKDEGKLPESWEALEGYRLAISRGFLFDGGIDTGLGLRIVPGESDQENLARLLAGEVDYALVDELTAVYIREHYKGEAADRIVFGTVSLLTRALHLGLRRQLTEVSDILSDFDRELLVMLKEGAYHRILGLNWLQADADGDGRTELILNGSKVGVVPPSGVYRLHSLPATGNPTYLVSGQKYKDWESIPAEFKAPLPLLDLPDGVGFDFAEE